jgi:hypothetical protein
LIEAALRDVPPTLADMENTTEYLVGTPKPGERIVLYARLIQELAQKRRHGKAAAEWAIHRLVEQGMLTIRQGRCAAPGVIGRDGAWMTTARSHVLPGLQYSLVHSTLGLWQWWREREEDRARTNLAPQPREPRSGGAETPAVEPPATLEQLRDWLAERVRWLRDWHLAADPKPLAPGLQAVIVRMFRGAARDFPNDPQNLPQWASQYIWRFSEITAHQAHAALDRLGILDAPAWPSPDIERDMRALIVALDHLAALLAFVAQRSAQVENASPPLAASSSPTPSQGEGTVKPRKGVSATRRRRDKKLEARDEWLYHQCCAGIAYKKIQARLQAFCHDKGWPMIGSIQGIRTAARRYAQQHERPNPPKRQNL